MDSPFMETVARGLADRKIRVVRFEFPYMERRRSDGKRRPPDGHTVLRSRWLEIVDGFGRAEDLVIGGKSMGGRIASMLADEIGVRGLVCLGYPFHPAGRPDELRVAHLQTIRTPTLILQGARDALGNRTEIEGYRLSKNVRVEFLEDGDHSFNPRVRSGRTEAENLQEAVDAVASFTERL